MEKISCHDIEDVEMEDISCHDIEDVNVGKIKSLNSNSNFKLNLDRTNLKFQIQKGKQ